MEPALFTPQRRQRSYFSLWYLPPVSVPSLYQLAVHLKPYQFTCLTLVIREFCALDMPVLMIPAGYDSKYPTGQADGTGAIKEIKFGELLPLSFGPEHLELPRGPSS